MKNEGNLRNTLLLNLFAWGKQDKPFDFITLFVGQFFLNVIIKRFILGPPVTPWPCHLPVIYFLMRKPFSSILFDSQYGLTLFPIWRCATLLWAWNIFRGPTVPTNERYHVPALGHFRRHFIEFFSIPVLSRLKCGYRATISQRSVSRHSRIGVDLCLVLLCLCPDPDTH